MRARQWLAALGVAAVLGLVGAPAASAAPAAVGANQAPVNPNDTRDELDIPEQTGNGDTPVLSGFIDEICPAIKPPTPMTPTNWSEDGGGNGQGLYGRYGWAGLYWTTYDQSCLSPTRLDTGTGSGINDAASQFDAMVNDAQKFALDPETTIPFDPMMEAAATQAKDTLFSPWLLPAFAAVGFVIALMAFTQSGTAAANVGIAAVLTLGMVMFLSVQPTRIPRAVDAVTAGVTQSVSSGLVDITGGSQYGVDKEHATQEAYYRATSYQAWLQGMFCGDTVAEAEYGERFLDAQAFTVAEWKRVQGDSAAQRALTVKKQQDWLDAAQQLQKDRPAAFACWSGEQNGRISAATKHSAATVAAGLVVFVTSGAVIVMRWVLRIGILLAVGMGALLLASRRITSGFVEILVLGVVGPPVLAMVAGITLFGFSATMRDPDATWWQSILSVFFMGIALWWLRKPLGRVLHGIGESGTVASYAAGRARRASSGMGSTFQRSGSSSSSAVAGAAAGAAVAGASGGGDGRRSERTEVGDGQAVDGGRRAGDRVERTASADDEPAVTVSYEGTPAFQPVNTDERFRQARDQLNQETAEEDGMFVDKGDKVAARTSQRLAGYQAAAVARGEGPSNPAALGGFGDVGRSAASGRGDGKFHAAPVEVDR